MGIFPEGKSTDQALLEMIRSGAARLALHAVEEGARSLSAVPIGLTYQRKEQFRSSVLVRVGEPIDVSRLLADHDGDTRRARRAFTEQLEARLKQVVVHLDEPQWEPWLDDLEELVPPPRDAPRSPGRLLWQRKRIADAMNYFLARDRARAETIAGELRAFADEVRAAGLAIGSPVLRRGGFGAAGSLFWSVLWLAALLAPAVLGTLYHLIPFVVVRWIASRMDQPGRLTISTHRLLVGVPIYLLWYLLVTAVVFYFSPPAAIGSLIAAPFTGLVAVYYWRAARKGIALLTHQLRLVFDRGRLAALRRQRRDLSSKLEELAAEYRAAEES